jgi:hypothetical protein
MLDDDFRQQYGPMARLVALDYANPTRMEDWKVDSLKFKGEGYPRFRTFNPYLGHSFAGGMGNEGNGISQQIRKMVTHPLLIPSYPDGEATSESLNVGIATAIILAEFRR